MKSREAYKRFLLKANKNDTNEGVSIPVSHFVLMFNEYSVMWLYEKLRDFADNFNINDLNFLLKTNIPAPIENRTDEYVEAKLPIDLLRYRASHSIADRGSCTGIRIFNYDKNAANLNPILQDVASGPNFDYEETPCVLSEGKVKVFYSDFEIKKVLVTYYRRPNEIDIAGYTKLDGSPSEDIDPEFDDEITNEIINRVVLELEREIRDGEGFPLSKDRIQSEA